MSSKPSNEPVTTEVITLIPALRAFAWSLCRETTEADDLVQETLLKALSNIEKFQPGTQLRAWLFTIMRNTFYTRIKVAAREKTGAADCVADAISVAPTQEWSLRGGELMEAVARLPAHYRETLILVVMLGESYERTAEICGCRIGTVKSRINRARSMLMAELGETVH
ncbi:sigma-70 family RNA polymerase sigma factor [Plastorhodobacter daqingensis]|uniref:RNA polymerase sigma factor n=1 Tax=Plastorhodobacter daqingensis TaxID=1387281 RepID=A0ABW2UNM8_9RHOB